MKKGDPMRTVFHGLAPALLISAVAFGAAAADVQRTVEVPAPPDDVWAAIGGFCSIVDWHPAITSCEAEDKAGTTYRYLTTVDGATFDEQLMQQDDDGRVYEYTIVESPLPVLSYLSTFSVTPGGDENTSMVIWQGRFTSLGVEDEEAEAVIAGIYEAGLAGIADSFK